MQTHVTIVVKQGNKVIVKDLECHACILELDLCLEVGFTLEDDEKVVLCQDHRDKFQAVLDKANIDITLPTV